jgi:hypothetical protein
MLLVKVFARPKMTKAVSAMELAQELSVNTRTFRYYLVRNWGERLRYQRWLFTRSQANKIKAAYKVSTKFGGSVATSRKRASTPQDGQQLKMTLPKHPRSKKVAQR